MKTIDHVKYRAIITVMNGAKTRGLYTDFAEGSPLYNDYVENQAWELLFKLRTNPSKLMVIAGTIMKYAHTVGNGDTRVCKFAEALINKMSEIVIVEKR